MTLKQFRGALRHLFSTQNRTRPTRGLLGQLEQLEDRWVPAQLVGTYSNTSPITVSNPSVNNSPGSPYPSQIVVGDTGTVGKVTVSLTYSHAFPDDIDILLVSPSGAKVILISDVGGGAANALSNVTVTLDDAATTSLPDSTLITSGTYKPTNSGGSDTFPSPAPAGPYSSTLSAFTGGDANGTWALYLVDDTLEDTGTIHSWSLSFSISDTTPPTITNVSIPDAPMKVGDVVTATITVASDVDDYTAGGGITGTLGGFTLGNLTRVNDTTYAATFTVTDGGTDVAAGSGVPVNFTLDDSAGNTSDAFTTAIGQANDSIDANRPRVVSIARLTPAGAVTNADSLVWRVTFNEPVAGVDAGDFSVSGTTATVSGVAPAGGNAFDVTVSGGDLAGLNGTVALALAGPQDVADAAGNALTNTTPTGTDNPTFSLDNAAPGAPATAIDLSVASDSGASNSDNVTSVTAPTLRVSLAGTGAVAGDLLEMLLDGSPFSTPVVATLTGSDVTNGFLDFTLASGSLGADGVKTLAARVTDQAGNVGTAGGDLAISLDNTAPGAPTVVVPGTTVIVNADTHVVSGTAEPTSLVRVYRDANNNGVLDEGDVLVDEQQLGDTDQFSFTVSLEQDAENRFLVTSTDAAGTVSVAAVAPLIIEDSTAPAAPTVTSPEADVTVNAVGTHGVTGTAEPMSLVKVYRDANGNGALDEGDVLVAEMQLGDTESYAIEVPLLANAANRFLVTATDAAGNQSQAVVVPAILQVTTAPVSGVVFLDYNADGTFNGQDAGLAGRRVYIDANGNNIFDTGEVSTFTDGGGAYRFDVVGAGANPIRVELFPSEALVAGPNSETVLVTAGQPVVGADLGLRKFNPAFAVATSTDLYGSDNPNLETALVRGLFMSVLGREGTAAEVQVCAAFLQNGGSLAVLGRAFLTCGEYLGNQVDASFRVYLDREADPASRAALVQLLSQGMRYEELAVLFLSSEEYQARYPGAEDFARSLFRNQLGRDGSEAEVQGVAAALTAGFPRAAVARAFVYSPESYLRGIDGLYAQFLGRPGEDAGRLTWLAFVSGGGRLTDLAVQFVSLPEFSAGAVATVG